MYWLFLGVWPTRDENNNPIVNGKTGHLADGFFGVLWGIRGDLDHLFKFFGFPSTGSLQPCGLCLANKSDIPWTDHKPTAKWMSTIWTNTTHAAAHPNRHGIFKLPGVGVTNVIPDIMHVFHLGAYQYFHGSVLKLLTHNTMGGTIEENLANVWDQIEHYYKVCLCMMFTQLGGMGM